MRFWGLLEASGAASPGTTLGGSRLGFDGESHRWQSLSHPRHQVLGVAEVLPTPSPVNRDREAQSAAIRRSAERNEGALLHQSPQAISRLRVE